MIDNNLKGIVRNKLRGKTTGKYWVLDPSSDTGWIVRLRTQQRGELMASVPEWIGRREGFHALTSVAGRKDVDLPPEAIRDLLAMLQTLIEVNWQRRK